VPAGDPVPAGDTASDGDTAPGGDPVPGGDTAPGGDSGPDAGAALLVSSACDGLPCGNSAALVMRRSWGMDRRCGGRRPVGHDPLESCVLGFNRNQWSSCRAGPPACGRHLPYVVCECMHKVALREGVTPSRTPGHFAPHPEALRPPPEDPSPRIRRHFAARPRRTSPRGHSRQAGHSGRYRRSTTTPTHPPFGPAHPAPACRPGRPAASGTGDRQWQSPQPPEPEASVANPLACGTLDTTLDH